MALMQATTFGVDTHQAVTTSTSTMWDEVSRVSAFLPTIRTQSDYGNWHFPAEMSPEDIFDMFFGYGGGRAGNVRFRQQRQRTHFSFNRPHAEAPREEGVSGEG